MQGSTVRKVALTDAYLIGTLLAPRTDRTRRVRRHRCVVGIWGRRPL